MTNSLERPRWFTRWSVRTRILTSILLVAAIGLASAGFVAYIIQRERVISELDAQLTITADQVRFIATDQSPADAAPPAEDESSAGPGTGAQDGSGTETSGDEASSTAAPGSDAPGNEASSTDAPGTTASTTEELLRLVMQRVVPHHNESSLGVIDGNPRFLPGVSVTFVLLDYPELIDRAVAEVALNESSVIGTYASNGTTLRYLAVPVAVTSDTATGVFLTAIDVELELAGLGSAFITYTWVAIGALATIGIVGWFVAGRLLRPLRDLEATASRITLSDLSQRIEVSGTDDVSRLATTVNRMLERLEHSVSAQGQLLDDVRHELRTPLTIIRGHLELLDSGQVEDVEQTRDLVIDEIDRMSQLVSDIELLAEGGTPGSRVSLAPVDLHDLTAKVFAKAAINPTHEWELANGANVVMTVDAQRITQAWLQLVDNAVKHTPHGTRVIIGTSETSDGVDLWVQDEGPGVPPEALTRIFDRFGRAAVSRGTRGSGLGLSIVQTIVHAHGGTTTAVNHSPGVRFTMSLPGSLTSTAPDAT